MFIGFIALVRCVCAMIRIIVLQWWCWTVCHWHCHAQTTTLANNDPNMTKPSQIQAWLNGLYTENRYGQRMTSKHVHAGRRPVVPAPVMIKCNPIFHHLWRSEQYGAFGISLVNQNQTFITSTYFVCIEIMFLLLLSPAVQIAANCGYFVSLFRDFWKTAGAHRKI